MFIKETMVRHLRPPKQPSQLPSIDHNGTNVEVWEHYGYSTPSKGPAPKSRVLYAARDANQERHWRGTYEEIKNLIDRNFQKSSPRKWPHMNQEDFEALMNELETIKLKQISIKETRRRLQS